MPNPANPQSYNRYSYTYNNPIFFTDPSGHCAEPITFVACITAIGAGLGYIADYYVQYSDNRSQGMRPLEAIYHENINEREVAGATLAGGVSGAGGAVLLPLVPQGVAAAGLSGSTGSLVTVGGSAGLGGIINTASDFIGRKFETMLGSSREGDMHDLSSYTGSFTWGAITSGGASAIDEILSPLVNRSTANAQANFIDDYMNDAHIQLWDTRIAAGDTGWPPSEELFDLVVPAFWGPPQSTVNALPETGLVSFSGAVSDFTSVAFNADSWKTAWNSIWD